MIGAGRLCLFRISGFRDFGIEEIEAFGVFGILFLEFGTWNLRLGICDLEFWYLEFYLHLLSL